MSSETLLPPQRTVPRWLTGLFLLLASVGFVDATYLTVSHYGGEVPTCSLAHGCDAVLTSVWATVGPLPVALVGAVYYLVLVGLVVSYFDTQRLGFLRLAAGLTAGGFVVSVGLVFLQAFVINAWCQFCLLSAATSAILFGVGVRVWRQVGYSSSNDLARAKAP